MIKVKNQKAESRGSTTLSTISVEKNLSELNTHKVFYKKARALEFLEKNPNLFLFSEDYKYDGKIVQKFIVASRQSIYKKSLSKKTHLYEYRSRDQKIKLHLDIDIKIKKKQVVSDDFFDTMLDQCINDINQPLSLN